MGKRRRKRNRKRGRKKRKVKSEQQILQELALVHSMAILLEEEETFISESLVNDIFSFVGQAESKIFFSAPNLQICLTLGIIETICVPRKPNFT